MQKNAALPLLFMLLSGCSTMSVVDPLTTKYKTTATDCKITYFKKIKPTVEFEMIAKIESHIQQDVLFGGVAKLEDEAYAELKKKTCRLGGNAIIIDDYVESRAAEFSHVHVWATAIRLSDHPVGATTPALDRGKPDQ